MCKFDFIQIQLERKKCSTGIVFINNQSMGNSHPPQHKNLTKNWLRISDSLLRNTLTNELIEQTDFTFQSQEMLDRMASELRFRAGNVHNNSFPKLIYFMQHVERNTCSFTRGSYRMQVYTQYLPFTLTNTKPTHCLCLSLINTCTQLIDKHGFFRIRPNMVFLNLIDQKASFGKKYTAKMWVNSCPGKCEVEEAAEEDQTCQDIKKLFSHLNSIQSCENLRKQRWTENECKKIAELSKIIKDLHIKPMIEVPPNIKANQRQQKSKETPVTLASTSAPVYRARFCTEVPKINSPQLQPMNQSMDRVPLKPLPIKPLQFYSPPIMLKMSSSISKTPPSIKFDRTNRAQTVNTVISHPVLAETRQGNLVSSQKDINHKVVKFGNPLPLRESYYSFCRLEPSLKREDAPSTSKEKSGEQEGRARMQKQSIRIHEQTNSSRQQPPQQTSHFNYSNLQQTANLHSSRANSQHTQQTGKIIVASKGSSKQNSPEPIDKPQKVSEGYLNPFLQSAFQKDNTHKPPSQHPPTFVPSTMNTLQQQRKKQGNSPERSIVKSGEYSVLNKDYNIYLNKFKEITKIGKNEAENRIASALPAPRGNHFEQIGQQQPILSYREKNKSLYENSKEVKAKQKTEEELPYGRRDSGMSHRASSVMKKIQQIELEKDLEKQKEIIKFEKQFRSGLNRAQEDQQLKKKVKNKKATFAELKMEASKILDDLLI